MSRSKDPHRWWIAGLIGVAFVVCGTGWYQALLAPPYSYPDEPAHTGYVLELQAGRLPRIDGPIDGAAGGPELRERLALSLPRNRDVWVANNPPGGYVLSVAPAAVSRALGVPGGPLLGVRLAHTAAMAAGCVLSCVVARRLAGGDARVGLVAGYVTAAVPHTGYLAGQAMVDGFGVLATFGTLEALTRPEGRGSRRWWGRALTWAAFGAAVRPMTALTCAALVVAAAAAQGARAAVKRRRSARDDRPRWTPGPFRGLAVDLGPALAVGSIGVMWYSLNWVRYGGPTASSHLFEKFGRGSAPLADLDIWRYLHGTSNCLFTYYECTFAVILYTFDIFMLVPLAIAAVVALGISIWDRFKRGRPSLPVGRPTIALGIVGLLWVVVAMSLVLPVAHWTGGGVPHPRYALAMVPALAALGAAVIGRIAGKAGLLLLWAAPTWVLWSETPRSTPRVPGFIAYPPDSPLIMSTGPVWLRGGGLLVAAVGALVVLAAIVALREGVRAGGVRTRLGGWTSVRAGEP